MFYYHAVFQTHLEEAPAGLIVEESVGGPLRAVIWNHRLKAWTFNPTAAARFLRHDDYEDRRQRVDRTRAEEIARNLGTELPSEEELHRICEEGVAAEPHPAYHGWTMRRPEGTWSYYKTATAISTELPGPTLIVVEGSRIGTRALIWDRTNATWRYDPTRATLHLHETHSWTELDRATAEDFARTTLGTELPSEETLHQMCEEGETTRFRPAP
jgi:hypothetical protein